MSRRNFIGMLILFLAMNGMAGFCLAAADGPLSQVKSTVEHIISILQDESLQADSQKDKKRLLIFDEVEKRFNFDLMAKLSLGNVWERLGEKQQQEFAQLFSELLKSTYIHRVEGYSGEKVLYGKELIRDNLAQVSSIFAKSNSQMSIVYKLRKENGEQWLVYDVIIEGASLIKQYRRQFSQILDHEEFKDLIIRLEDKMKTINSKS